jgi:hypothetical protein
MGVWWGARALFTLNGERPAGPVATDQFVASKQQPEAHLQRRAGPGCGSAALISPRAGNGGDGEPPLARGGVGSVCNFTSIYIHH